MKQLGNTYIETWVEVPTKKVNGEQRYKHLKVWVPVPHDLINPIHLRKLRDLIEDAEDGILEITIPAEHCYSNMPKYYKLRGVIQHVVTISQ